MKPSKAWDRINGIEKKDEQDSGEAALQDQKAETANGANGRESSSDGPPGPVNGGRVMTVRHSRLNVL
jgi:hypothetical protein